MYRVKDRRDRVRAAAVMAGTSALLAVVGVALVLRGTAIILICGLLLFGWGVGGLASAAVLAWRTRQRAGVRGSATRH
jgi:hypothetical protein